MLFNSLIFLVFGAVFFALWPVMKRTPNLRYLFIVVSSFIFYGWWDWRFLFLIVGSGLLDYMAGLGMRFFPRRKLSFLLLSLAGNIGSLFVFKYSEFVAENIEILLAIFGLEIDLTSAIPSFVLILPVGISFYTFQSMSYTIDIYRGNLAPTDNILHFFAYLAMFPQLVAGPVIRASDLLPQLTETPETTASDQWEGFQLIVHGFFKKVVLADNLAPAVAHAFSNPEPSTSSIYWWAIISAFAFQIYCDFSGYSDIARGLARWMGFDFMLNFDHPYLSTSCQEFWTRWHISLSTWFRDYVYIPLGGSHTGRWRSEFNMWITMLVSGYWHGAAWNFVLWGALHAAFLSIERVTKWPAVLKRYPGGRLMASVFLLLQVWIAWVFFRSESLGQAFFILDAMFSSNRSVQVGLGLHETVILGIAVLHEGYSHAMTHRPNSLKLLRNDLADVIIFTIMLFMCVFFRGPGSAFIYFQF